MVNSGELKARDYQQSGSLDLPLSCSCITFSAAFKQASFDCLFNNWDRVGSKNLMICTGNELVKW